VNVVLVSYDISDDKRRTRVAEALLGWGRRLQYSVYECVVSDRQLVSLVVELEELIDHLDDQVLLIGLGPLSGTGASAIRSLGRHYEAPSNKSIVV